ncbi:MAG: hypothetical protein JXA64_12175 [Candidatus Fermentibacteraceae bacterium]|nr:hypothetical protein [Candidatus Fermentibacteraceae bacterium]MBN2609856.1 hypothetical protein [Candidatus Fermentibacteraceae bacterium]
MALFESGPRKTLKKIRKFAEEGSVNKVSSSVKEEKGILLEESDVALELVELLLDIGHPNLAASVGEEVMRRHRQIATEVRDLFIGRMNEFSRSTDLLRVSWRSYMDMHDFRGALELLRKAEEITVNSLFDIIREKMQSSMRFDGTVHPEADQSSLVEWALYLHRERRSGEAIDFLWKVCREVEFPHRDLPLLAFWIGNQIKDLDSLYFTSLMGIAAVSGKMDQALQFASKLADVEPNPDEATDAAAVIEKYLLPNDRSGRSAALLAEMYTAAGKTDAASKTLESIYGQSLDREELESAIDDLVAHPDSGAAPLLLSAQMNLEKGRIGEAVEVVERAFEAGDAEPGKLIEVCRSIIKETGDRTGNIATKLAHFLTENGEIGDAVVALIPIVDMDASWVFEHVQNLINRDRNNASVLSLLAVVLFETGNKGKATATLEHLSRRRDKKFCTDAAAVLDQMDNQVSRYPDLLEARALFRLRSERDLEAAGDWFKLLLGGRTPVLEGQQLLSRDDVQVGSVSDIVGAGFKPSSPWQALIVALVCLRENNAEQANSYLGQAMEDPELQNEIVKRIDRMPDDQRNQLDLKTILTRVNEGPAAETAASILGKIEGDEEWKVTLATSLKWENPAEVAQFRFKYLISRDRVVLAGSSFESGSIGEPLIESVAQACTETVKDNYGKAIELLEKPVVRPWSSEMARRVLEFILPRSPANGTRIRMLLARSFRTEKKYDEVSAVLEPVLEEEGVLELLEEMVDANPGEYSLLRSLTRTAGLKGDFDRFHKYSAVLLEVNGDSAQDVVEMASAMGERGPSGLALIYAARIASRYRIKVDLDELVTRAVVLLPEIAGEGLLQEFHRMGPVPRALCALASGNGEEFGRVLRGNDELALPLNESLLKAALSSWSPKSDGEALLLLAGKALSGDFPGEGEDILCSVASTGEEPWKTRASRKLLEEAVSGRVNRIRFWESVDVDTVIADALEQLVPDDYSNIEGEELKVIAPAVLNSGQGMRRLFQLADDEVMFPRDDTGLRRKLAESCLQNLKQMPEGDSLSVTETEKLVDILLSSGMLAQAAEVARNDGSDSVLSVLSKGLAEARASASAQVSTEAVDLDGAYDLIISGKPDLALEVLERAGEDSHRRIDLKALALWTMGQRQQAIHLWLCDFRKTSDVDSLKRLFWALEQSGARMEMTALRRIIADKYPGVAGMLARRAKQFDPARLETISGLSVHKGIEGKK